jgi:ATP-dependent RNA helicase DDX21
MLNMGFAEDVEVILEGMGSAYDEKTQVLLFSATTPPWVREIGSQYQKDVLSIDITGEQTGSRVATTVRHVAVQVPFGADAKKEMLEDIIAVEISKDLNLDSLGKKDDGEANEQDEHHNAIAAAVKAAKSKTSSAFQQKLFGKTIVFTETKAEADELVSGSVFKTLTAQAIHGDIGQKQRDATLAAFRAGAFNVLVATDVAARGIDIKDVDLVIQFHPPRDTDTYVHRSGRTGRAGAKGISVLLFQQNQARDIVRIERSLGHGFKFDLLGPPSTEAALNAAAKTSALACQNVADETAEHFKDAAHSLLANSDSAEDVVARCLAAIARRTVQVESRSLLTGELGFVTIEMTNSRGRNVSPGDVMFTVSKLARMSAQEEGDLKFDGDIGKIQTNYETGSAMFDMGVSKYVSACVS